jgi:ribosomal protein S26
MVYSFLSIIVVLCINCINNIIIQKQINILTHEDAMIKEHLRQVSYASVYMGSANGAFPINSEKITLRCLGVCDVHGSSFPEYKNIHCFYNLQILEMDWRLLDYPAIYPEYDVPNMNIKKLILNGYDYDYGEKKIFENYPNLEELELRNRKAMDFGGRFIDISPDKFCNPSTKLKKIVFDTLHINKNDIIDFTPIIEYYSTTDVEVAVNVFG